MLKSTNIRGMGDQILAWSKERQRGRGEVKDKAELDNETLINSMG